MRTLILIVFLVGLTGCFDMHIGKKTAHDALVDGIPEKQDLSFQTKEDLSSLATANMQKAAQVYYEGTEAKSPESEFLWQASIRLAGILNINTNFDPNDPEALKGILDKGTKAIEEKNQKIAQLEDDVKDFQKKVLEAQEEYKQEKEKSGWLASWIRRLIAIMVGLFVIQIITGLPVFTGFLSFIKKGFKALVTGIQEFREDLKKKAAEGDERAKEDLARLDGILDENQENPKLKTYIKQIKNGG